MSELEFKRWVRKNWDGWSEAYEPRRGTGVGISDLQIIVDGEICPIELKLASDEGERIFASDVRPAQIGWHKRLAQEGVVSLFLFGDKQGKAWKVFAVAGGHSESLAWAGELLRNETMEIDTNNFSQSLRDAVRKVRMSD